MNELLKEKMEEEGINAVWIGLKERRSQLFWVPSKEKLTEDRFTHTHRTTL